MGASAPSPHSTFFQLTHKLHYPPGSQNPAIRDLLNFIFPSMHYTWQVPNKIHLINFKIMWLLFLPGALLFLFKSLHPLKHCKNILSLYGTLSSMTKAQLWPLSKRSFVQGTHQQGPQHCWPPQKLIFNIERKEHTSCSPFPAA